MISGIYFIHNTITGQFYIGSAINFDNRWYRHKRSLNRNEHHCPKLQEAWLQYGNNAFVFKKYEYVNDLNLLLKIEQNYLDKYWDNGLICYNKCKTAGSWFGMHHTEETKIELSKQKQGSNNAGSKLTEADVYQIKQMLLENKMMVKEIAFQFNIDRSIISRMINGDRWKHCFTDEELHKLQTIQSTNKQQRVIGANNPYYKANGELNPNAKLTPTDVVAIKNMLALNQYSCREIGQMFRVGNTAISDIKLGKKWAHIKVI